LNEREVKLSAPAGFRWPAFGGDTAITAVPLPRLHYQTSYFDTADLRLARWGCSLRHRSGEGWTLKLPTGSEAPLLVRGEHRFEGDAAHPPDAALWLVAAYVRGAATKAVARLKTVRQPVRLEAADGTALGEMVLDEVSVLEGRRLVERFREIEVEVAPQTTPETLEVILSELRAAGAAPTDPIPKYARALGTRAWLPPEVVVGDLGQLATAGQLVRNAIASSVDRYLRQEPGVRVGEDPEAVHQTRVATRRLRSDLRTFGPLLEDTWAVELAERLRWLGALLGGARDADVLHARLRKRAETLPEDDRPAGAKIAAELTTDQEQARVRLLAGMGEDRYVGVVQSLVDAARSPRLLPEGHQPAGGLAPRLLSGPWRKLRREVRSLTDPPEDAALHEVRIRAKRVRYAAEAVAPVLGRKASRFARAAAELQEILGEHHDAVVTATLLRERSSGAPPEVAFAAGELAGLEQAAADRARSEWPAAWKRLRKAAKALEM
jgi:CHAD domain-containing protein